MYRFNYHRVSSLAQAAELRSGADDAVFLAGGMTLIPTLKQRLAAPTDVVDLAGIEGLNGVTVGDTVTVGAMTPHADVAGSAAVQGAIPALADLAGRIGDAHVRNRGTIGGSIANSDPAADYPAAVVALNATVHTDRRDIAGDGFFLDLFETALEPGEIVTSVEFPIPARAAYAKFPNPASRYAIVGVMVAELDGAIRVGVTGAGALRLPLRGARGGAGRRAVRGGARRRQRSGRAPELRHARFRGVSGAPGRSHGAAGGSATRRVAPPHCRRTEDRRRDRSCG